MNHTSLKYVVNDKVAVTQVIFSDSLHCPRHPEHPILLGTWMDFYFDFWSDVSQHFADLAISCDVFCPGYEILSESKSVFDVYIVYNQKY